jgi:hypothetical protein
MYSAFSNLAMSASNVQIRCRQPHVGEQLSILQYTKCNSVTSMALSMEQPWIVTLPAIVP